MTDADETLRSCSHEAVAALHTEVVPKMNKVTAAPEAVPGPADASPHLKADALQRAMFNSANFSYIATDAKGVIQIFNRGAERMLGYTAEEVMNNLTPSDLSDPEELVERAQMLSVKHGIPITPGFEALVFNAAREIEDIYELTYLRKDGSTFPAVVSVTALRGARDAIIGYLLIGTDNAARKTIEKQLRWAEQGSRLMVESVTDCAIVQLDAGGSILSWNTGAQRIQGYSSEEIIGQHSSWLYRGTDIQDGKPKRDLDEAAAKGRFEDEGWRVRKGGTTFWASVVIEPIRDHAGNLRGFTKLTRDLTERRQVEKDLSRARDEALQASHAKSEFLASMSHEIRTPMNGVIGMTEILQGTLLTSTQREAVETIRFSGQLLLTIINDILDFSKIEAGMMRLEIVDLGVHELLERTMAPFVETAADKGLKLDWSVEDGVPAVLRGDPGRLHQVLTNLVANAMKFTQAGAISVSVSVVRGSGANALVRFTVRDSGIGVSAEAQRRLFQPFMQADGTTTRKYGGSGLGLAISKQLAEVMGGEIGVESEAGKGSTFWFTARLEKSATPLTVVTTAAQISAPPPRPVVVNERRRRARILVAEDNPVNQLVARQQLDQLGLTADVVDNGSQAVAALRGKRQYDLVLMDCQMPEMDGFAATAEIRRHEGQDRHTWIIAMTAYAMGGDRAKCLAAGMDDYLAKPVTIQALREALQRFKQRAGALETLPTPPTRATNESRSGVAGRPRAADFSIPPVNLEILNSAANGDPDSVRELADLYLVQTTGQLSLLGAALAERSATKIQNIGHRCKGGSGACGVTGMETLFGELETLGREGRIEEAERLSPDIAREFSRVQVFLKDIAMPSRNPETAAMKKILIIDDDPLITTVYEKHFRADGFEVRIANSGKAGLIAVREFEPDAVLLDLNMPDVNGVQWLQDVRKDPKHLHLPVVVFTAGTIAWQVFASNNSHVNFLFKEGAVPKEVVAAVNATLTAKDGTLPMARQAAHRLSPPRAP